ncbi:MAG: indolepyruvate ferredoxin oxidoreductase subunit alpha, partial [Proteobacteria bacterium]|nr:indolepyruvate ferredoxin oxidoreductase subunit alpha [Pseudomonadota bacterium]
EWSTNEKVAMEVAAAASLSELRSICVLKQNGVNVASDFFLHLAGSGTRSGMLIVPCEDPGALSSINEGDSRHFSRMLEVPLLEPGDFQEAKDMTKWGFELSEELKCPVMLRSVTRLSHASGNVVFGELPDTDHHAQFKHDGFILDPDTGIVASAPVPYRHGQQQEKLKRAIEMFETSPFNVYTGPDKPELLVITSSACNLYTREAIKILDVEDRVGLLKLGTTWPLPPQLLEKQMALTDKILIVEEVIPFLEENVKIIAAEKAGTIGIKTFYGKRDGSIPSVNELNPDLVVEPLAKILNLEYEGIPADYAEKATPLAFLNAPVRDVTFCPGCPHRASFWNIHNVLKLDNREGFVCGDIGCYSMAMLPTGFSTLKTLHAMGSGTGMASGFGQLGRFGMDQPVLSVSGDSTFFHAVLPALVNAVHHKADITLVVLDNSGTAMTGFQSHPGLDVDAQGNEALKLDIQAMCESMGITVRVSDPFDFGKTQQSLFELLEIKEGVKVLIMKQICALSPEKKHTKKFEMSVSESICQGKDCGCNRLCTRIFRCPGLIWNSEKGVSKIDEAICAGCGICQLVCPVGAIEKKEVA